MTMSPKKISAFFLPRLFWPYRKLREYFRGELSTEERFELENAQLDDPLLDEALEGYRWLRQAGKALPDDAFFRDMEDAMISSDTALQKRPARGIRRVLPRRWASAAAVAALLIVGYIGFSHLRPKDGDELFASLYRAPELELPVLRSFDAASPQDFDPQLMEAFQRLEEGHYEDSFLLFRAFLEKQPNQPFAQFYAGIAAMEANRWPEAQTQFENVLELNSHLVPEAQWFLALSLWKQGRNAEAKQWVEQILSQPGHPYKKPARKLQKALEP